VGGAEGFIQALPMSPRVPNDDTMSGASLGETIMRILVVEDDRETSSYIANGLIEEGHSVDCFADGRDGLLQATTETYDVMIVDRMLPGLDGLSLVRTLRSAGRQVPVIFLTSLGGVDDRVTGLEVGGDDYVSKPFAFSELLARIHALARRPPLRGEDTVLSVGDLQMDLIKRTVIRRGERIELQPREFRLLEVLLRNKGRVLTRTMLLERVWDFHFDPKTSVVETHISRLRTKIDKPFDSELIQTVRGTGYRIHAD
jgi:two-component system, OmpR family, response regulator